MKASGAIGLLLVGSMSIFGILASHRRGVQPQGIEPVYYNGQEGVYSPITGEFVPSTAANFAEVCDQIRDQRSQNGVYGSPSSQPSGSGSSGSGYYNNGHYFHYGSGYHWYGGTGYTGSRGYSGSSFSSRGGSGDSGSSSSFGSSRGGIGGTGHSFGGTSS